MLNLWKKKSSIKNKRLSQQFRVFALLLLLMPTIVFIYIVGGLSGLSELLQAKYLIPYLFSIIIILSVLSLLQTLFSQLSTISAAMTDNSGESIDELREVMVSYELHEIADGFESLLEKYRKTGDELQSRVLELMLIKELAQQASSSLDISELLHLLLEKAMQVNKAQVGSILLIDETEENFRIIGYKGPSSEPIVGSVVPVKNSIIESVVEEGSGPLLVENIETDQRYQKKNNPKYDSPSFFSLPVRTHGKLIAVLNLADKKNGEHFRQEDVDLTSVMVQEVSFALENARIHSELKKQAASLEEEVHYRKQAEKELKHLAHSDPLTGLSNRYLFLDRLEVAVAQAERQSTHVTVLFVDLNRFKEINDTLGHSAGDKILCEVANRMKSCVRKTDLLARYGGDEFTIILTNDTTTEGIENVASKVIDTLSRPFSFKSQSLTIGCSIGISTYPDNAADAEALIRRADAAMYTSKRANSDISSFHYFSEND